MDVMEKLVELMNGIIDGGFKSHSYSYESGEQLTNDEIASHLIAHGVTVREWISVDDRLPDETGRYLAVKKRIAPDELGGNRTDIVILRFFVDDGFRMPTHIPDWINGEINEEVTHWMPLPSTEGLK